MVTYLMSMLGIAQARYGNKDKGAAAVEYGLLVGLIAVAVIGALVILGPQISQMFTNVSEQLPG